MSELSEAAGIEKAKNKTKKNKNRKQKETGETKPG